MNPVGRVEAEYRENIGRVKLHATEKGRWGLPAVGRVKRDGEVGSSRSGEELDFLSMCERKASEAVSLKCGFFSTSLNIDI